MRIGTFSLSLLLVSQSLNACRINVDSDASETQSSDETDVSGQVPLEVFEGIGIKVVGKVKDSERLAEALNGSDAELKKTATDAVDRIEAAARSLNSAQYISALNALVAENDMSTGAWVGHLDALSHLLKRMAGQENADAFYDLLSKSGELYAPFKKALYAYDDEPTTAHAQAVIDALWAIIAANKPEFFDQFKFTSLLTFLASNASSKGDDSIKKRKEILSSLGDSGDAGLDEEKNESELVILLSSIQQEIVAAAKVRGEGTSFTDPIIDALADAVLTAGDGMAQTTMVSGGRIAVSMIKDGKTSAAIVEVLLNLRELHQVRMSVAELARTGAGGSQLESINQELAMLALTIAKADDADEIAKLLARMKALENDLKQKASPEAGGETLKESVADAKAEVDSSHATNSQFGSGTDGDSSSGNGTSSGSHTSSGSSTGTASGSGSNAGSGAGTSTGGGSSPTAPLLSYASATGTAGIVDAAMNITPTTLNNNGAAITSCGVKSGTTALPAGLTVNSSTCVISGTPTSSAATATYTIVAQNSAGTSADATVSISVSGTSCVANANASAWNALASDEANEDIDVNMNGQKLNGTVVYVICTPRQWISAAMACTGATTTACAANFVVGANLNFADLETNPQGLTDGDSTNNGVFTIASTSGVLGYDSNSLGINGGFSGNIVGSGSGKSLTNIKIDLPSTDFVGLIGKLNGNDGATSGNLRNLTLGSVSTTNFVNGRKYVGGFVGYVNGGKLANLTNYLAVNSPGHSTVRTYVGGIAGGWRVATHGAHTAMSQLTNHGAVTFTGTSGEAMYAFGGIVGAVEVSGTPSASVFEDIINNGAVTRNSGSNGSDSENGGIIGNMSASDMVLRRCSNRGNLSVSTGFAGGVVGNKSAGTVSRCYNSGSIGMSGGSAMYDVGGIVGYSTGGTVEDSYNTGSLSGLSGNLSAGIVGALSNSTVSRCYNVGTIAVSSNLPRGGFGWSGTGLTTSNNYFANNNGEGTSGTGVTGMALSNFSTTSNFASWDFTNSGPWEMVAGKNRPTLRAIPEP
jgi:hypothetical protein